MASTSIGSLTVKYGTDRVLLYGSLDLTRDKADLAHARALKALRDVVVGYLVGKKELSEAVPPPAAPKPVPNPFG